MGEIWTVITGLILTCLIIYFAYRFSKLLAQRTAGRFKNRYLKEIDRMMMGQEQYISLVRVGSEIHLIGVTRQNINYMSKIDDEALVETEEEMKSADPPVYNEFLNRVKDKMGGGQQLRFGGRTDNDNTGQPFWDDKRADSDPHRQKDFKDD